MQKPKSLSRKDNTPGFAVLINLVCRYENEFTYNLWDKIQ